MTISITDLRVQRALVLYKTGKGIKAIRDELHLDENVIKRFLKEEGLLLTASESVRRAKSTALIKDDALDVLTPEALYWIGFIYADGHLAKDRPRIVVGLAEVDKTHVQKFVDFFGVGIKIFQSDVAGKDCLGYKSSASWRGQFSSRRIYDRLISLGIEPGKTYKLTIIPDVLKYSRDFWRGVIDGDGSIYINNHKIQNVKGEDVHYPKLCLGLCGNETTINSFLEYVISLGIQVNATIKKSKKSKILYETSLSANELTTNTLEILYKNAPVYLDRKYQKYLEVIKKYKKPTK